MSFHQIKAICFDVIGTVVDWRGTIMRELAGFGVERVGANLVAQEWASYYASGPFKSEADLAAKGRQLLDVHGLSASLSFEQVERFSNLWTNLTPWPDVVDGLARLRSRYKVVTLTNCGRPLMANLSRNVGLVWDEILSAEDVGVKKPDPKVYWHAVDKLGPPPKQILMVAAHLFDVRAAQDHGFRTAYVQRRDDRDPTDGDAFDFVVADFKELADQLGV